MDMTTPRQGVSAVALKDAVKVLALLTVEAVTATSLTVSEL